MKICIVSDSHDHSDLLAAAVESAHAHGAQAVIHCGDIIGASTLMVNPGTVAGLSAPSTYAVGDLATGEFRIV